jgi:hypothetical protein
VESDVLTCLIAVGLGGLDFNSIQISKQEKES